MFLTQEEALEVGLGDQAAVYFPATGARVTSVVSAVDRTSGYIDEVGSRYHWRGPKDRSARVTLGFTDMDAAEIRRRFAPGLPAVAIFKRAGMQGIMARLPGLSAQADETGPADAAGAP